MKIYLKLKFSSIQAVFKDDQLEYGIGSSLNTSLTLRLFPGAPYDSYQMSIYAQVMDAEQAFTIYQVASGVTVIPDETSLNTIMYEIVSSSTSSLTNLILHEGDYGASIEEL